MDVATLGWFIAVICATALVALWFTISFKELSVKRKRLAAIGEQVQIHRRLYMQERGGENDAVAKNILENKLMVYRGVEKEYNVLLKKPLYRIPAYIMRFYPTGRDNGAKA